jgi:sulfite exporter TauE/SafE
LPQLKQMDRLGEPLWRIFEPLGRKLLPVRSLSHALLFGAVWGWLPCGLVYYALLLTLSAESAAQGVLYMLVFGLGTLPAVALMGSATGWVAGVARNPTLQRVVGLVLVGIGIFGLDTLSQLGDCRKRKYRIAKGSRSSSRSASGSIAGLCDCWRDTEGGREDEQVGIFFDRNRLSCRLLREIGIPASTRFE